MAETIKDTNYSNLRSIKIWSLVMGISMIVLGLFTISFSVLTTLVSVLFLGIILIIRGAFEIVESILTFHRANFWQRLLTGVVSLGVGIFLVSKPVMAATVLTLTIAAFLVFIGLYRAIEAAIIKPYNWEWIMLSGFIAFVLGLWVSSGWPVISLWFIGLLIGVEILSRGIELTMLPFIVQKGQNRIRTGFGRPAVGH